MEPLDFLLDLLIVFAVAGCVVFLFHRLRVPSVVGLLVGGLVTGPYGLGLVHETEHVPRALRRHAVGHVEHCGRLQAFERPR
ncbi:MAG: cation:proton antiporter [Gemmataceae bacterium]|nr:cation:proton antiporter [Gemmataceae bacterium]MCI0739850.1 cation:proton antiporter [Gemmataceae bacterium]